MKKTILIILLLVSNYNLCADVRFGNSTIIESTGKDVVTEGGSIVPNEYRHDFWIPSLQNKNGVFISLGTLRSFNEAALGNFSHIVLLDYDSAIVAYNKLIIEILKVSPNRKVFMSLLMRGEFSWKFIRDISHVTDGNINTIPVFPRLTQAQLIEKWRNNLPVFSEKNQILTTLSGINAKSLEDSSDLVQMISGFVSCSTYSKTIFGSDALYNKARTSAWQNKYYVVLGNIGTNSTMKSLAEAINNNNLKLDIVDFSNAVQYLTVSMLSTLRNFITLVNHSNNAEVIFTATSTFHDWNLLGKETLFKFYSQSFPDYSSKVIERYMTLNNDIKNP